MKGTKKMASKKSIFNSLFMHDGLETLTDELIASLSRDKKIPIDDLRYMQKQGVEYCRDRNSFVFPPEFMGPD
jgi:hypothetical protein